MNIHHPAGSRPPCARTLLAASVLLALASAAQAAPVGGVVAAGTAAISTNGARTTITQGSASTVINWQGFGIAAGEAVQFKQPGSSSVALNRVVGGDPSAILGNLSANGKVFLVNPNGVLFGKGATVNVGGLVASTLNISDTDFMAGRYAFSGTGRGSVVNEGTIQADGGYVALIGGEVRNDGVISARLGSVALAAGQAITLDVLGDGLLQVTVDRGLVDAAVRNGGLIQADGGQVLLTTQAAGSLMSTVVNNTGVIQAQTISNQGGTIRLMADMANGVVTVAGTLDASAPNGGNGGFIETSAARVRVQDDARVSTSAPFGRTGDWLIDPQDFTIGGGATDNISGATLSGLLVNNSVVITTAPGSDATVAGTPPVRSLFTSVEANGDIHVNQAVSWTATPSTTTLTLNASRDVNINQAITATNGNFVVCCGRDVNVNAAITTTSGSVLISAGRNAVLNASAAMTTTFGNMMICAANDVRIGSALTLTSGSSIPSQSLGLQPGMVLSAGTGGTGAGTVVFAPLAPKAAVNGPNAPVTINYNPPSYSAPTDYTPNFTLTLGSILQQHMLVFAISPDTVVGGANATTLAGLKGAPAGVTLVAGAGSSANYETATLGANQPITFTGYTLAGPQAGNFALPVACCGPAVARTTGTLLAAAVPVVVPPVVVPPVVVIPPAVVPVIPPVPVIAVPVPVVVVAPPVVLVPDAPFAPSTPAAVIPQFAPFVVAPLLLQTPMPLLVVSPETIAPMQIVMTEAPAQPVTVVAPAAPAAPAAAPSAAPATAPAAAPARPAKLFRN